MPPRPETKVIVGTVVDLILGAAFLGSSSFSRIERVFGALIVIGGVKKWCDYWAARDRHEAWKKRYRR